MKNLARDALQKLRAVENALAHYSLDGDNLKAALEALRDVVETEKVVLYDLIQRPTSEDLMVGREVLVSLVPGSWRTAMDDYLAGRGTDWGVYNAARPEPAQRDQILSAAEVAVLTDGRVIPVARFVYARVGAVGFDTMRVLVCDGPSMLACVGILQPDATTERQRDLLARLVPAFRKRLIFERLVGEATVATGAFAAALEQINAAVWLLDPDGRISHANAAGRARFDTDRASMRNELAACVAGTPEARFKVTPLRNRDASAAGHLVVEMLDGTSRTVASAARRYNLTPAQTRVLERVARGVSNSTIAAELQVAERTVEAHVTAILVKAQVASRSALIVQIYADSPGR